ncbi:MAG TPA: hypothetical protein VMX55_06125 [candidate division Zixibacteria bacterium]|nr:hypothetical protein [candidate division Zixibacteria bacterium]
MVSPLYSDIELDKFLLEILSSKLSRDIFLQLNEDGGNTVMGIVESLHEKGIPTAKTRVYEEISVLLEKGLIKRISKRPPVYTVNLLRENLEELASKFYMDTREELMRRWAASYTFLPEFLKSPEKDGKGLSGVPMVNFNPYPIVDTFNVDKAGIRRYLLRAFESNNILISNTVLDVCLSTENYHAAFEKENYETLFNLIKNNHDKKGQITLNTLSTYISKEVTNFTKSTELSKFYKQFFKYINYEIRKPVTKLSSFVLGQNNVLFPIGLGSISLQTYLIVEIRDSKIVKNAQSVFNKAWSSATPYLKIENGEITKGV